MNERTNERTNERMNDVSGICEFLTESFCGSEKNRLYIWRTKKIVIIRLLGTGVFGDGLSTLTNSVLSKFTGKQQPNRSLDFSAGDSRTFVIMSQTRCFGSNTFEDIINETVHDAHRFTRYSGVWMHLLQHFVYVDGVTLLPPTFLFFVSFRYILLCLSGFLGSFTARLGWHLKKCQLTGSRLGLNCGYRHVKPAVYKQYGVPRLGSAPTTAELVRFLLGRGDNYKFEAPRRSNRILYREVVQ